MYKDRVRNARTNIAFNLARDLTRASYRSISITEKNQEKHGLSVEWGRDLMTNGMEKTDMLNAFFALISTSKTCLHKGL